MIVRRRPPGNPAALPESLHPVVRRVYASRGITDPDLLPLELRRLAPPTLGGLEEACDLLAEALGQGERIVVAGDYDADGATSTALAVSTLRAFGGTVDFCVPDRFRMGYGLSPGLAEECARTGATLLVTVDCGISSHAGILRARELGMRVVVTDHHLPGSELPDADAIVNPNCDGDPFPSKHLAGVGVMFYVLAALRSYLREADWFPDGAEPSLSEGLDLVALGTVADLVRLDHNNRILVQQGLRRIRAGRARPGINALLQVSGRPWQTLAASDLGFALGPRLNAAGRLTDMRLGVRCLLAESLDEALPLAQQLDGLNRERRELQQDMEEVAIAQVVDDRRTGVTLFDAGWHEGVVGLVASRLKERLHRPAIAFARSQERGMLKGSARSIPGLHVRDVLAAMDAAQPGLIERFGGHAMAAGLSLDESRLDEFARAFDDACARQLDAEALTAHIETDGILSDAELSLDTARALEDAGPWGQGFTEPCFDGRFEVADARIVGEAHVKYRLRTPDGRLVPAIHFRGADVIQASGQVEVVYRPVVSRWQGESLELHIEHLAAS